MLKVQTNLIATTLFENDLKIQLSNMTTPDLSEALEGLSVMERAKIMAVLERDMNLQHEEEQRLVLQKLQFTAIEEDLRDKQRALKPRKFRRRSKLGERKGCNCCGAHFGIVKSLGFTCFDCGKRHCADCSNRVQRSDNNNARLCMKCHLHRSYCATSNAWFYKSDPLDTENNKKTALSISNTLYKQLKKQQNCSSGNLSAQGNHRKSSLFAPLFFQARKKSISSNCGSQIKINIIGDYDSQEADANERPRSSQERRNSLCTLFAREPRKGCAVSAETSRRNSYINLNNNDKKGNQQSASARLFERRASALPDLSPTTSRQNVEIQAPFKRPEFEFDLNSDDDDEELLSPTDILKEALGEASFPIPQVYKAKVRTSFNELGINDEMHKHLINVSETATTEQRRRSFATLFKNVMSEDKSQKEKKKLKKKTNTLSVPGYESGDDDRIEKTPSSRQSRRSSFAAIFRRKHSTGNEKFDVKG